MVREAPVRFLHILYRWCCWLLTADRWLLPTGMYGTAQHTSRRARALGSLRDYSSSVLHENQASASEFLEAKATSRGISSSSLDELASMLHGVDGASAGAEPADPHQLVPNHRSASVDTEPTSPRRLPNMAS